MIKNLLSDDEPAREVDSNPTPVSPPNSSSVLSLFDSADEGGKENFVISETEPQSMAETVRQSGLAYSAGIALFAAVVFMMVLGWGADLLLGTSPWGIVGGILLGSVIGFIQFFRITSQIFKK
ncbi:MAG TPA: AtpZ/AtpI family protein [Pyrinomonadaceae bacterium]|nr:AtpZ/AtpI family protein [Pyrinomonadaceae bacterium]